MEIFFFNPMTVRAIINVCLRGGALISRFFLLFFLAKFLGPAELGLFGLISTAIGFGITFIGGEYYTYSIRELLSTRSDRHSYILQHQAIATILLYFLLLPTYGLIFYFNLLDDYIIIWFFSLLILEHISQELFRILNALHRQLAASLTLFIRSGLWVWIIIPIMWLFPEMRALQYVLGFWLAGSLSAMLIGLLILLVEIKCWKIWKINTEWLARGFKTAFYFFVATISIKFILIADRFLIEQYAGLELLGVYTFYAGIAMVIINILEPLVFVFIYPSLIKAYRTKKYNAYHNLTYKLYWSTFMVIVLSIILIVGFIPFVLTWIEHEVYRQNVLLLWILLAISATYGIGIMLQYNLYAEEKDGVILFSHLSATMIYFVSIQGFYFLSDRISIYTIASSVLVAFCWIVLVKGSALKYDSLHKNKISSF